MLKSQNVLSMNLLSCINQIKKIALRNMGLFCSTDDLKDKFFNKNAANEYTSIKLFPDDEEETFNKCFNYVKIQDSFSNTVLGAFLDSLNSIIGTDKCNYLSNLFSMDPIKDKEDPLLPKDLKELANKAKEKTSSNKNSISGNSPLEPLENWSKCAKEKTEFNVSKISELFNDVRRANYVNPNGLSTYIGRADISYNIIKEKFNIIDYPYYQIECTYQKCQGAYKDNKFSTLTDLKDIVGGKYGNKTELKVSCCDKICVVYVKIQDQSNSHGLVDLEAAEIFKMNGDKNSLDITKLDINELKNAEKCLKADVPLVTKEDKAKIDTAKKEVTKFVEIFAKQTPVTKKKEEDTKDDKKEEVKKEEVKKEEVK